VIFAIIVVGALMVVVTVIFTVVWRLRNKYGRPRKPLEYPDPLDPYGIIKRRIRRQLERARRKDRRRLERLRRKEGRKP